MVALLSLCKQRQGYGRARHRRNSGRSRVAERLGQHLLAFCDTFSERVGRRQRLLLRTRYAPKARTAIMMPAAIHWSPGFGKRLKLGIMAQRLLRVPRRASAVVPISSCRLVAKSGGDSSTRPSPRALWRLTTGPSSVEVWICSDALR